jgi:hypothetical protein
MTPRLNFRSLLGLFWLFVCSSSFSGFAQCDEKKVRKLTTTHLGEYSYETASFRPVSGFGSTKVIDAFFIAYGEEKYRVVNLCHGHEGEMGFEILDANRNVLFSNAKSTNGDKFDFIAKASGDYIIRFKYPSDSKSGCVAYAIGYK